jgi:hypothetical protein
MTYLTSIISDLRDRRLWPLAVALLAALVAVPMLLSKPAAKVPIAAAPQSSGSGGSGSPTAGLPVVTASAQPGQSRLKGRGHDPFSQRGGPSSPPQAGTVATPTAGAPGGAGTTGGSTGGAPSTPGSTAGGTTTTPGSTSGGTTTTPPIVPQHPAKPAPTGLTSTEAYEVTISITDGNGVDKIGSLERLGTLPQGQQSPLLVELGVLKGGRHVLFAVQPGAVLQGPGTCTPGPINCQVLSLATDQIERVGRNTTTGVVSAAMFAVTAISAHRYTNSAQAEKARTKVSPTGRRLLSRSNASAVSLFPYKPGLGALVDLRDLTIGGN